MAIVKNKKKQSGNLTPPNQNRINPIKEGKKFWRVVLNSQKILEF